MFSYHLSFSHSLTPLHPHTNTHTPLPSTSFLSSFFNFFFYTSPSWSIWFPLLLPLPPSLSHSTPPIHTHTHPTTPPSSPPPLLLCAKVIVDAKGRGPRGSYQPITSVGMSGDEMECSRPAGGLDGSFNAERGVCKQTAADRVYACHNRSGPWSIFALPFRSPFLSPLSLSVSIFSTATRVTVFYFTSLSPPPKTSSLALLLFKTITRPSSLSIIYPLLFVSWFVCKADQIVIMVFGGLQTERKGK